MATEMVNLTPASLSSVVNNEMGGRKAALPHEENSITSTTGSDVNKADANKADNESNAETKNSAFSDRSMQEQAQKLQELSDLKGWNVSFHVDEELETTVIKVIDADTKKTIRQIPSEEMLSLSKRLQELRDSDDSSGLLFSSEI
jgi:Uncharacterized flagellar protein FlaG